MVQGVGGALVSGATGSFTREFAGVLIAGNSAPIDAECYFYPTVSSLGSNFLGDGTVQLIQCLVCGCCSAFNQAQRADERPWHEPSKAMIFTRSG